MFRTTQEQPNIIIWRFGGGINSRTSEDEINIREASEGDNFNLDLENSHFEPRKPFELMGTATNASDIQGYAQLLKADGTISTLIQAGTTVYEWDGGATFTSRGTVSSACKLRGPLTHNYTLDDVVIITDMSLTDTVYQWDGTTFGAYTHNLAADTGLFYAKYAFVHDERLWFGNCQSGTYTPHLMVGSTREDKNTLSVTNKPSSALGEADPFYMLTPDLRPINGMVESFGRYIFSSVDGNMYALSGGSAKDFFIEPLYNGSAATGDESVVFSGNDVIYGRAGAIESLRGAETFGDVENDDLSKQIAFEIDDIDEFRLVYDRNKKRLYVFPDGEDKIWVFHKPIFDQLAKDVTQLRTAEILSPWVCYTTLDTAGFQPTTVWTMLDPATRLPRVFFGDSSGNIYAFEGVDYVGDGGDTAIRTRRTSKNFVAPPGKVYDVSGWVRYRSGADVSLTLEFLFGGVVFNDNTVTMLLPGQDDGYYFGGAVYFGGDFYFDSRSKGRIAEQPISSAGRGSEFQVVASVESVNDFSIAEIGLEFNG